MLGHKWLMKIVLTDSDSSSESDNDIMVENESAIFDPSGNISAKATKKWSKKDFQTKVFLFPEANFSQFKDFSPDELFELFYTE